MTNPPRADRIQAFFENYREDGFEPLESDYPDESFNRLCQLMEWTGDIKKARRKEFMAVVVAEVKARNFNNLQVLQNTILAYELRTFEELPTTKTQCKKVLEQQLFANIFDYLAGDYTNFPTLTELSN